MEKKEKKIVTMTEGSIPRLLIRFAIPLLLGNIFQQFYNMVDTWVVGNYVSNEAFSAVGTVGPVINMLIGLFLGLSSGAGVVISQFFGAGKEDRVRDTVHTAMVMTLVLAVIMTFAGLLLKPLLLSLMKTPAEVYAQADAYLSIYFAGVAGLLFYNIGASILQGTGDSQRPFYFLATAAVLNIILDLVFVLVFRMGVEGVAWATIIAQAVSAVLIVITLMRVDTCVRLNLKEVRFHSDILARIVRVGIPAALQMAIISFSNIFVQSYINQFGADIMSGWTAYSKIDALMLLPMQSIGLATTTFVGQNVGVGKTDRAKQGVRISILMSFIATVIPMVPVMIFAPQLVSFFNSKAEVISAGAMFLHWISPFYVLSCPSNVHACALRGSGNSRGPMFIQIASFVVFRQIYLFIMSNFIANEPIPIAMGYPAGWMVCMIAMYLYYRKVGIGSGKLV
jgi:putative MATE family efflux protein